MKTDIKMKYGSFEFPSNPQIITAEFSSKIKHSYTLSKESVTEKIANEPSIISGNGIFFEDNAELYCQRLSEIMKDKSSHWLFCPGIYPVKAYLSKFTYQLDCKTGGASYTFQFTSDRSPDVTERKFFFTYADDNENAFDIANRCGISVDDIIRLNDLETPFDIRAGRRIKINENNNNRY